MPNPPQVSDTGWQDFNQTPQAAPQQAQPAVAGAPQATPAPAQQNPNPAPQKLSADDTGWQEAGTPNATTQPKDNTSPKEPGMLDVANEAYQSDPNASTMGKIGRSLGRTALMLPNMLHTAVGKMTDEEANISTTAGGGLKGLAAVEAKRFLYDPSEASWNNMHNIAEAGRQNIEKARASGKINDARAKELLSSLQAYEKAGKALSAIPLFGPIAAGLGEQASKGDVAGTLTDIIAPAVAGEAFSGARGVGKGTFQAAREGVTNAVKERVAPTTAESPMGAQIPVRSETGLGKAVAAGAPEETAQFAQTRTAPAVQKAVGGTVGEALGSEAPTVLTAEDRMGIKGHANDLIENQARPTFKRVDELSGNKLTEAQNKIQSGWSQRDMTKVAEGELEKSTLYDQYREKLKAEGLDVDEAERNYGRGKAAERMAKRLDTATGPTTVKGARYELDGKKLMKVVDDGVKNGSWKKMGLTEEHIGELESLAKTAATQTEIPKVNAMVKGLGKLAVTFAGLHGGVLPAIEAVTGLSAADHIAGKISRRVMQDAMLDFDAAKAANEAVKTGDAKPVIDALSKNPDWVKRTAAYVTDLGKRLWKDESGELRIGKQPREVAADQMIEETLKNGGATFDHTGNLSGKDAWSVSAYPERSKILSPEEVTPEAIRDFTEKNRDLLAEKGHAVGSWKDPDTGKTYLDVTRLIKDKAEAVKVGQEANQKSIWHLKNQELLDTGGTGEAPKAATPTRDYKFNEDFAEANNAHSVTTKNAAGEKIGELAAQETGNVANRQVTVRSNQVYDAAERGKGHGKAQIVSLLENVPEDVKAVKSDISTTKDAQRVWESLQRQYPEAITKKVVGKGDSAKSVWTVDMDKFRSSGENRMADLAKQALPDNPAVVARPTADPVKAYRQSLGQKEIATRNPSSASATGVNDPAQLSGIEALNEADKMSPTRMTQGGKPILGVKQKLASALSEYKDNGISHALNAANPDAAIEKYVSHLKDNLKWLHGVTPESIRDVAHQWYESAHDVTKNIAEKNGVSHEQSAAVTAALSPKNDWNNNVGQAQRLIEHYANDRGHAWTTKMGSAVSDIQSSDAVSFPLKKALEDLRGKKYNQLTAKTPEALLAKKALWMRVLDEAHGGTDTPIYAPDGSVSGSQTLNWGQVEPIAKAIAILEDGSVENIHRVMGQGHKIRNFYNNIINPWSDRGHVTIDTHAVGAGFLKPFSQDDVEVAHNFGSGNRTGTASPAKHAATGLKGSYSVHEEAYRRAAKELGIQPRQLQSITWEGIRSLMGDEKKTPELRQAVTRIWRAHEMGQLTLDQAREEIIKASGGFSKPAWMSDEQWERNPTEAGDTSFNEGGQ